MLKEFIYRVKFDLYFDAEIMLLTQSCVKIWYSSSISSYYFPTFAVFISQLQLLNVVTSYVSLYPLLYSTETLQKKSYQNYQMNWENLFQVKKILKMDQCQLVACFCSIDMLQDQY